MTDRSWLLRAAKSDDDVLLSKFTCAEPSVGWQLEVQEFIRLGLADWAFDPHAVEGDPRLLLALHAPSGELAGVAAHERTILQAVSGETFAATKLEVVALAAAWQGRRFESGERASDVLMSAVMTDISARVPPRDARVFAIVHEDNLRSLALLRRYGFVEELSRPHPEYRRVITAHKVLDH
ncbi:hypothetical protein Lfu02_42240 [Longispora fulva]|uniref:Ribosomal protein S18 acetylase RimI-like enzyme n=1 Tax=Longispora fulva TaxID=619741 RepID=A0A8J7KJ96_9ACTN|nr:hypothetical protein [Longispora fulva]MBG6136684.1 ribosomal protein S18 acetylase RimI-like enzyme [Longispora fulva]GIG59852.1 hypothetical protein Lfu02_42240 [Longispora fulva]